MSTAVPASILLARPKIRAERLPTGFVLLDESFGGIPRGAVTELTGSRSSGKTSLLHSVLAQAAGRGECCAFIDTNDAFDPCSAAHSGVELDRLVWVRCRGDTEAAMKAADLIVHGGGFGMVCLDLSEVPLRALQRIPLSWWWRFRRGRKNAGGLFGSG